jgi:hypothetical protein
MKTPADFQIGPPPGIELSASLVYRNITPAPFLDVFRNYTREHLEQVLAEVAA